MKETLTDLLAYDILETVNEIPKGKVATYGQIAKMIGKERNARLVGKVLSRSEYYGEYPCFRVVNHEGRLVPGWDEQYDLLVEDGAIMKDAHHVDLKKCQWENK